MKALLRTALAALLFILSISAADKLYTGKPLKALIITGGCCHNYKFQSEAIKEALTKAADSEVTVVNEGGTGTRAEIDF